jgi:hypothetical protein
VSDLLLAILAFLAGYAVKAWLVREQERDLSAAMGEVARLTAQLEQERETEAVYRAKAELN